MLLRIKHQQGFIMKGPGQSVALCEKSKCQWMGWGQFHTLHWRYFTRLSPFVCDYTNHSLQSAKILEFTWQSLKYLSAELSASKIRFPVCLWKPFSLICSAAARPPHSRHYTKSKSMFLKSFSSPHHINLIICPLSWRAFRQPCMPYDLWQ